MLAPILSVLSLNPPTSCVPTPARAPHVRRSFLLPSPHVPCSRPPARMPRSRPQPSPPSRRRTHRTAQPRPPPPTRSRRVRSRQWTRSPRAAAPPRSRSPPRLVAAVPSACCAGAPSMPSAPSAPASRVSLARGWRADWRSTASALNVRPLVPALGIREWRVNTSSVCSFQGGPHVLMLGYTFLYHWLTLHVRAS
jgi:hypothetical protein